MLPNSFSNAAAIVGTRLSPRRCPAASTQKICENRSPRSTPTAATSFQLISISRRAALIDFFTANLLSVPRARSPLQRTLCDCAGGWPSHLIWPGCVSLPARLGPRHLIRKPKTSLRNQQHFRGLSGWQRDAAKPAGGDASVPSESLSLRSG